MTKHDIANLIERFVSNNCDIWEWDDFISIKQANPEIEKIRLYCADIINIYPSLCHKYYCSQEGIQKLKEYAILIKHNCLRLVKSASHLEIGNKNHEIV